MTSWYWEWLVFFAGFAGMECVGWLTHRYIMHGVLWSLHKEHHQKYSAAVFQQNDLFFLFYAVLAIACMYIGTLDDVSFLFFLGFGITMYGLIYFFVHDVFIHQRFRLFRKTKSRYLLAVRRAHKAHHKHLDKRNGECFGMLWVPLKFFRKAGGL